MAGVLSRDAADELTMAYVVVAQFVYPFVANAAIVWDEGRRPEEASIHGFPAASRWSASFFFSTLAFPVHFARTRRGAGGVLGALAIFVVTFAVFEIAPGALIDWLSGSP